VKLGCVGLRLQSSLRAAMSTKWSKKGITAVCLREFLFSNASSQSTGTVSFSVKCFSI